MGDKEQTEVPKSVTSGDTTQVGNIRLQKYTDKDVIHVHDDNCKLCFEYAGRRAFQLAIDSFLRSQHDFAIGTECVIPGKGADLVLERTDTRWLMKVVAKDSVKGILIGDPVVTALDEFAQRI